MSDKAGHLYKCACCSEDHPEGTESMDAQLCGPVCPECRRNSLWAIAYMKKEGIDRPVCLKDINDNNSKRFSL
jgi:hypothetical protein